MSAEKKLRDSIEQATSSNDPSSLIAAAVEAELENERRELDIQYQRKVSITFHNDGYTSN